MSAHCQQNEFIPTLTEYCPHLLRGDSIYVQIYVVTQLFGQQCALIMSLIMLFYASFVHIVLVKLGQASTGDNEGN